MPALAAPACSHSLGARLLRYAGHCSCRAKGPAKGCRTGAQPLFPVAPLFAICARCSAGGPMCEACWSDVSLRRWLRPKWAAIRQSYAAGSSQRWLGQLQRAAASLAL